MPDLPVVPPGADDVFLPAAPAPPMPDPRHLRMGQLIGGLLARAQHAEQFKLQPMRDAKLNAILDNQAFLMESMAFLLNELLLSAGAPAGIKFEMKPAPGNGGDGPRLVVPS